MFRILNCSFLFNSPNQKCVLFLETLLRSNFPPAVFKTFTSQDWICRIIKTPFHLLPFCYAWIATVVKLGKTFEREFLKCIKMFVEVQFLCDLPELALADKTWARKWKRSRLVWLKPNCSLKITVILSSCLQVMLITLRAKQMREKKCSSHLSLLWQLS